MSIAAGQKPVSVFADELTQEEVFALQAIGAYRNEATLERIADFQKQAFGMSQQQKAALVEAGVYSLMARGILRYMTDEHGKTVHLSNGQPVIEGVPGAKVVARLREYKRPASIA